MKCYNGVNGTYDLIPCLSDTVSCGNFHPKDDPTGEPNAKICVSSDSEFLTEYDLELGECANIRDPSIDMVFRTCLCESDG